MQQTNDERFELETMSEHLYDYAVLERSEIGNYARRLVEFELTNTCKESYGASDEFVAAFTKEVKRMLDKFKNETRVVVTSKEVTRIVESKELEWLGE